MWKYTLVAVSAAAFLAGAASLPAPAAPGRSDPVVLLAPTNTRSTAPASSKRPFMQRRAHGIGRGAPHEGSLDVTGSVGGGRQVSPMGDSRRPAAPGGAFGRTLAAASSPGTTSDPDTDYLVPLNLMEPLSQFEETFFDNSGSAKAEPDVVHTPDSRLQSTCVPLWLGPLGGSASHLSFCFAREPPSPTISVAPAAGGTR